MYPLLYHSASTNAVKILILLLKSKMWTMIDLGPPLVFMISALSTLLEKSTLVLVGRFLPFLIIVTYAARLSDVSFHIVAIAIGKLGQVRCDAYCASMTPSCEESCDAVIDVTMSGVVLHRIARHNNILLRDVNLFTGCAKQCVCTRIACEMSVVTVLRVTLVARADVILVLAVVTIH